jgi:hypothetical protein
MEVMELYGTFNILTVEESNVEVPVDVELYSIASMENGSKR